MRFANMFHVQYHIAAGTRPPPFSKRLYDIPVGNEDSPEGWIVSGLTESPPTLTQDTVYACGFRQEHLRAVCMRGGKARFVRGASAVRITQRGGGCICLDSCICGLDRCACHRGCTCSGVVSCGDVQIGFVDLFRFGGRLAREYTKGAHFALLEFDLPSKPPDKAEADLVLAKYGVRNPFFCRTVVFMNAVRYYVVQEEAPHGAALDLCAACHEIPVEAVVSHIYRYPGPSYPHGIFQVAVRNSRLGEDENHCICSSSCGCGPKCLCDPACICTGRLSAWTHTSVNATMYLGAVFRGWAGNRSVRAREAEPRDGLAGAGAGTSAP